MGQLADVTTPTSPLSRLSASFSNNMNETIPMPMESRHHDLRQCADSMGCATTMYTKQEYIIQFIHHFVQRQQPRIRKSLSLDNVLSRRKNHSSELKKRSKRSPPVNANDAFPIERGQPHLLSISRRRSSRDIAKDSSI